MKNRELTIKLLMLQIIIIQINLPFCIGRILEISSADITADDQRSCQVINRRARQDKVK